MKFELVQTKTTHIHMWPTLADEGEEYSDETKDVLDLKFSPAFSEEENTAFAIFFKLGLWINAPQPLRLKVEFQAEFKCPEPLTEDNKKSHFVKKNAPAIAFPFLRSYVANLMLNAGYRPILLKPVNFAALPDDPPAEGSINLP